MPYAPFTRVTFSGDIGPTPGTVEHFSFGLSVQPGPFVTQTEVDACWTAASGLFTRAATRISVWSQLTQVKVSSIGADGKLIGNAQVKTGSVAGANTGTEYHPPQVALVVGLDTGQRGPSKRGRLYLPMPVVSLEPAMTMTDAQRDSISASVKTFLDGINTAFNSGSGICVASRKGFNTDVTGFRVGRVLDTMRSRRRSLNEGYEPPVLLA
jgi:hypothetical protein